MTLPEVIDSPFAVRLRGPIGSGKTEALTQILRLAMARQTRPVAWLAAVSDVGLRTERVAFANLEQAKLLGADQFEGRLVRDLSSGERQRVRLALALEDSVKLAVLDEPCRHLDPDHIEALQRLLTQRKQQGMAFAVSDLREHFDASLFEQDGFRPALLPSGSSADSATSIAELAPIPTVPVDIENPEASPLKLAIPDPFLLCAKSKAKAKQTVTLPTSRLIVLTGPNGSGKTSLLSALAKAAKQSRLTYGYSRQEPEHQVFATTPRQELSELTAKTPWGGQAMLESLGLGRWLDTPTPSLPVGILCLLGTAIALAQGKDLILLDEPTQGLDQATARALTNQLFLYTNQGATILVATHDPEVTRAASIHWAITAGTLTTDPRPESGDFPAGPSLTLPSASLKTPSASPETPSASLKTPSASPETPSASPETPSAGVENPDAFHAEVSDPAVVAPTERASQLPLATLSYATAFGALWGAVEITLGSFLHALKLPFTSVLLAATGTALLVCLRTLFPKPWVVLTAGLMCAGIKLLSPAGQVLGPMIAITVEAALVELVLRPTGVNRVSAATAGALTCLYCIVQKLVNQLIFMGMPIIGLYVGVAKQAEKTLRLPAADGAWVVALFLTIVALIGVTFGLVGARVGQAAKQQLAKVRP